MCNWETEYQLSDFSDSGNTILFLVLPALSHLVSEVDEISHFICNSVERFSLGVKNPTAFLAGAMVSNHLSIGCQNLEMLLWLLYNKWNLIVGYNTRVFLCRCLLWWTHNSSNTGFSNHQEITWKNVSLRPWQCFLLFSWQLDSCYENVQSLHLQPLPL